MENKKNLKRWFARDINDNAFIFLNKKPYIENNEWFTNGDCISIPSKLLKSLTFENSPQQISVSTTSQDENFFNQKVSFNCINGKVTISIEKLILHYIDTACANSYADYDDY